MNFLISRILPLLVVLLLQSCGGGGGGGSSSSPVSTTPTPLTVDGSSFVNKGAADLANFLVPDLSLITSGSDPSVVYSSAGYSSVAATLAVADFQQLGQYSAFVVGTKSGSPSRAYFLKFDTTSSKWVDVSDLLFGSDPNDRAACADPRQALVTKFNSDTKPDVYLVCAGAGGVSQLAYVSSGNGKYKRYSTNFSVDARSATIADINGDSYVDIITTHNGAVHRFWGSSDSNLGTSAWFAPPTPPNTSLVSISQVSGGSSNVFPSNVMNLFLIPRGGEIYLVTGGNGAGGGGGTQNVLTWHKNFDGYFNSTSARSFILTAATPPDDYRFDYVESNSVGYVYATGNTSPHNYLQLFRIARPEVNALNQPLIGGGSLYKYTISPTSTSWAARVVIKNGKLVPYDAGCQNNPVSLQDQRCAQSFDLDESYFVLGP